jgi:subtilisin family serine protease
MPLPITLPAAFSSIVHLAAPGVGIWTTDYASTDAYKTLQGTSISTPIVAGAVALVWSLRPGVGAATIRCV